MELRGEDAGACKVVTLHVVALRGVLQILVHQQDSRVRLRVANRALPSLEDVPLWLHQNRANTPS